jgi:hypothetical protein
VHHDTQLPEPTYRHSASLSGAAWPRHSAGWGPDPPSGWQARRGFAWWLAAAGLMLLLYLVLTLPGSSDVVGGPGFGTPFPQPPPTHQTTMAARGLD